MSNIYCLLDACTVINLIHIDEDDFILKKLNSLDFHINDVVFNEIRSNIYARLEVREMLKHSNKDNIAKAKKEIERKLSLFFINKKKDTGALLKELGSDFFDRIKSTTNYSKNTNGELCSIAYALYISRYNEKKVFFYTDDIPAKEYFTPFFDYQQIGHIKDSVDLIVLLYWLDEKFTEYQLKNILRELHSQYATDVKLLEKALENFRQTNIDAQYRRSNRDVVEKLTNLIFQLRQFKFQNVSEIRKFFENKRTKYKAINEILDQFSSVFNLDNSTKSENLLAKIERTIIKIDSNKIHKLYDLCSA